jgi:DNA-binding transcriptional LysR family regulator
MDIHQLRVFVSVYKNRSFSRASEELHLSQPTISDHVKTLEETLNARLFDRLGRSIAPTKEALVLYPKAVELIEKLEAIKVSVKFSKEEAHGELVVGASTVPGSYLLPRLTSEFRALYPGVSFQVLIEDTRAITRQVQEHNLLLGIVGARMEGRSLNFMPFMDDELVIVGKEDVLARNGKSQLLSEELREFPFVMREEGSGTRKVMEQYFNELALPLERLKIMGYFGSTSAVKEVVKSGFGIAVLSRMAVASELESGALKEIRVKGLKMTRSFYVVTHKKRTLPRTLELFFEHLQACMELQAV